MRRRDVIKLGIAGGGGLFGGALIGRALAQCDQSISLPDTLCRTPTPSDYPRRQSAHDLIYQGTHILTYGALRDLAKRYRPDNDGRLLVVGGGCDDGIGAVRSGQADVGGMCCPVIGSKGEGLDWRQIAWDIKVAITHPDSGLHDLPEAALPDIASGRLSDWSSLGLPARPIALVVRRHCPDYFEPVRDLLLDGQPRWSSRALWVDTDQQLISTVSRFPGSIGFISRVFARAPHKLGAIRILSINGIDPDDNAALANGYRLKGPMNLVWKHERTVAVSPLLEFIDSDPGSALLARQLVPTSMVDI